MTLNRYEPGATINKTTPEDGHCLFHSLTSDGLFPKDEFGKRFDIEALRQIALSTTDSQQLAVVAESFGMTLDIYREHMSRNEWGNELTVAALAAAFGKDVSVISKEHPALMM